MLCMLEVLVKEGPTFVLHLKGLGTVCHAPLLTHSLVL